MEPDCSTCKNFKWFSFTSGVYAEAWCEHYAIPDQSRKWEIEDPKTKKIQIISEPRSGGCSIVKMRSTEYPCGPEGKLYEPADL